MPRDAAVRRREQVAQICRSVDDSRALRRGVLDAIQDVVPFDAYSWLLTDPETSVGSGPLADVPCLPELPALIRLKYLTPTNRWTTLRTGDVGLLEQATGGDLARSLVWREMLSRYGVRDVASCVFRDRYGCWGFLELWRIAPSEAFTAGQAHFLAEICATVTEGLRRSQASTFAAGGGGRSHVRPGPVLLLLSPDLQVRAQTPETREYLQVLVPPPEDQTPIPSGAYNVAAQLLATEVGVDANPPSARVHLADGLWMTLRAARIGDRELGHDRDIAVSIERTSPAERLAVFARAFGLTPREAELLRQLATGSDTRAAARRMSLSEHTVQDHLKSIFTKTSTHSRGSLLSRAVGTSADLHRAPRRS
ncbi:MAG: helix-turn-helix transcriptional regulator [Actinomycetota bacterium]|nr:helix-turn-helix transcriptional regulator [Actinomycetota bacterium]